MPDYTTRTGRGQGDVFLFTFDQHIHCDCSPDSSAPMRVMTEAARDHGMDMILFTDHVDMCDAKTGSVAPYWPGCEEKMTRSRAELLADPPMGIEVRFGIELGEIHHCPERAEEAASGYEWDMVLGSLHNLRGTMDFYYYAYSSEAECRELNRRYLAELLEMTEYSCFDVMAHIGYTSRYMMRRGFSERVTAELWHDELEALLRRLIEQGRGIEVNTSGIRQGGTFYPEESILRLYRELGGEIVSVGSDAHTPSDAGAGIREAREMLRSLGFRYAAAYRRRKPEFNPL